MSDTKDERRPRSRTRLAMLAFMVLGVGLISGHGAGVAQEGQDVPVTRARRASGPIAVDGRLDEAAWGAAERVGPFVLTGTGAASPTGQATHARVLWDDARVYFAFEVEDRDVWARDAQRDDVELPADEVVEVFLDDGGEGLTYYELEVSPKNVVYDLLCQKGPGDTFTAFAHWDAKAIPALGPLGLETAVTVQGTLDVVASGATPVELAQEDRGWTVELALPWTALWSTGVHTEPRAPVPPRVGDRWRLGLYRIERPRVATAQGTVEYQAWSPTRRPSFHVPARFGVLEFAE